MKIRAMAVTGRPIEESALQNHDGLGEPWSVEAAVGAQKNLEPAEGVLRQVRAQLGREHGKLREQDDVCSISRVRRWLHL